MIKQKLTERQAFILNLLKDGQSPSVPELLDRMGGGVSKSTLLDDLDALRKQGLITGGHSRNRYPVKITEAGLETIRKLKAVAQ